MIAEFSYLLGQTWEYCENNLTMSRICAYRSYFDIHPPTHLVLAAWAGFKPKVKVALTEESLEFASLPDIEE